MESQLWKSEKRIKNLDKKIAVLKHEIYDNALSTENLGRQNVEIAEFMKKSDVLYEGLCFPDIFSYFRSLQEILNKNVYFTNIIDVLKKEVYKKPLPILLDGKSLLKSVVLPEKALYSQWILKTIIEKLPKKTSSSKSCFDPSFEALSILQKLMKYCNMPVLEGFEATLSILNDTSFKVLNDNEQDLLIFMHVTARMYCIFELMKVVDSKQDNTLILCSKAKRYMLQKRQIKLLSDLKYLIDGMENINLSEVIHAITKSRHVDAKTEETLQAYENFKGYITYVSGQANGVFVDILQSEQRIENGVTSSDGKICQKLDFKVQQCIDQGRGKLSENFGSILMYEMFQEDVKSVICCLEEFVHEMLNMSISDISDVRLQLNCLKNQVKFLLESKWNFQKHMLLPSACQDLNGSVDSSPDNKMFHLMDRSHLLCEHIKESMFYLRTLEEMEYSRQFSIMSGLCELRENTDGLIQNFRNFLIRIGHQTTKNAPVIKRNLAQFNKEIQILFCDYHKYRVKLQFLSKLEFESVKNMFEDIETVTMADVKKYKEKKCVGLLAMRRLNIPESEVSLKRTEDNLKEIGKSVDEALGFLRILDETLISKKFSAMRYLCELHSEKEQILSSFENLLSAMHKLSIEDDDFIIQRLGLLNIAADNLTQKYETLGMQLMLFSDMMSMVSKENSSKYSTENELKKNARTMNISDLFGSTEDLKKLHHHLDDAVKHKWFPAKLDLYEMLKDKQRTIHAFQNFLERMPELDMDNTIDIIHSIRQIIRNAENILRKFQSLRMQLIWIAADCVFDIKNV